MEAKLLSSGGTTGTFSGGFSDGFSVTMDSWAGMSVEIDEVLVSKSVQPKAPSRILSRDEVSVPATAILIHPRPSWWSCAVFLLRWEANSNRLKPWNKSNQCCIWFYLWNSWKEWNNPNDRICPLTWVKKNGAIKRNRVLLPSVRSFWIVSSGRVLRDSSPWCTLSMVPLLVSDVSNKRSSMLKAAVLDSLSAGCLSASMDKGKDDDCKMKCVVKYGLIWKVCEDL